MSEQDNIRISEKLAEAFNAHEYPSQLDVWAAPGYVSEGPDLPGPVGKDEEIALVRKLVEAFPDLHIEVTQRIAQGDFVVVNYTMIGTSEGPLTLPTGQTVPATGKKVVVPVSKTLEFDNGKLVRQVNYYDRLALMTQLGLMPGR
jgi:predicted ester cyclase